MEGQNQSIADIDQNKLESTLLTTENNFHWYKTALLILVGASVVAASAMFGIKVGKNQSIISKNVSQNETSLPESQVPTVEIAAVVTPTASLSQNTLLSFNQGKTKVAINLDEKPENVRTSVFEDYLIKTDFDSKYFVRFYKTVDSFKSHWPERSVDSDGTNAGQGEAVASESVNINGTNFFKLISYYNPISITKSGKYENGTSSVIDTKCFYVFPTGEVIVVFTHPSFDGNDSCQFSLDHKLQVINQ